MLCVIATSACALCADCIPQGALARLILSLGNASYSICLMHGFLIEPAARLWRFGARPLVATVFVLLMMVGTSILGMLTYRFVEKPLLEMFRRLRARRALPALHRPAQSQSEARG